MSRGTEPVAGIIAGVVDLDLTHLEDIDLHQTEGCR